MLISGMLYNVNIPALESHRIKDLSASHSLLPSPKDPCQYLRAETLQEKFPTEIAALVDSVSRVLARVCPKLGLTPKIDLGFLEAKRTNQQAEGGAEKNLSVAFSVRDAVGGRYVILREPLSKKLKAYRAIGTDFYYGHLAQANSQPLSGDEQPFNFCVMSKDAFLSEANNYDYRLRRGVPRGVLSELTSGLTENADYIDIIETQDGPIGASVLTRGPSGDSWFVAMRHDDGLYFHLPVAQALSSAVPETASLNCELGNLRSEAAPFIVRGDQTLRMLDLLRPVVSELLGRNAPRGEKLLLHSVSVSKSQTVVEALVSVRDADGRYLTPSGATRAWPIGWRFLASIQRTDANPDAVALLDGAARPIRALASSLGIELNQLQYSALKSPWRFMNAELPEDGLGLMCTALRNSAERIENTNSAAALGEMTFEMNFEQIHFTKGFEFAELAFSEAAFVAEIERLRRSTVNSLFNRNICGLIDSALRKRDEIYAPRVRLGRVEAVSYEPVIPNCNSALIMLRTSLGLFALRLTQNPGSGSVLSPGGFVEGWFDRNLVIA